MGDEQDTLRVDRQAIKRREPGLARAGRHHY